MLPFDVVLFASSQLRQSHNLQHEIVLWVLNPPMAFRRESDTPSLGSLLPEFRSELEAGSTSVGNRRTPDTEEEATLK